MNASQNEKIRRLFLLTGKPLSVLFSVTLPLLFHNSLNLVFSFFDTFIAANIDVNVVTTVSIISEIRIALGTISAGLAVGSGIIISRAFGNGDDEEVQKQISTVFFISVFIALIVMALIIPFASPLLKLCAFPEEFLASGAIFLAVSVLSLIFSFINTIFFTTEKARGRTKIVFYGNLVVLGVKTLLNFAILGVVSKGTITADKAMLLLPVSSGISYAIMTLYAVLRLFSKKNPFCVRWKYAQFTKSCLVPLAKLSIPVFIEKFLMPFGKVICNGLYIIFGSVGLAAYTCSQKILALASTPLTSFKDAESNIVSANLGNRDSKRAVIFLFYTTAVNLAVCLLLFTAVAIFIEPLTRFFTKGNAEMAENIMVIYHIERWAPFFDAIDGAMCGFLYARKKTKLPTIVNIVKLFGIRIPVFLVLTKVFGQGIEAVAWSILISNGADALLSVIFAVHAVFDLKKTSAIESTNNEKLSAAITALGRWDAFDAGQTRRMGITVPQLVLEHMGRKYDGTLSAREMAQLYKEAVIEKRIEALEEEEAVQ